MQFPTILHIKENCISMAIRFLSSICCHSHLHHLQQWSLTWAKTPPGGDFMRVGAILLFTRFGGDFGFQGGDFRRLKHTRMFNWSPKNNICYFGIKVFDPCSTPWFVTKVIKLISGWSRISQTTVTWFCQTLHCTKHPKPLGLWLVVGQALRFSRRF